MRTLKTLFGVALVAAVSGATGYRLGTVAPGAQHAEVMPRTTDGKPDLSGLWQTLTTAAWNIQDHSAADGVPAGAGVVEGNEIPYQPWALAQKEANEKAARIADPATIVTADPLSRCYMPGIPRATYLPYPFEIAQTDAALVIAYEFARTSRVIPTDGTPHEEGLENWMGDSRGKWEGDSLVVTSIGFNADTWFDHAGNFHSEQMRLVERFTPIGRNHLTYEVEVTDPKVFTRPWKIRMPLYRRIDGQLRALEYHCLEFLEPSLYGHLGRAGDK